MDDEMDDAKVPQKFFWPSSFFGATLVFFTLLALLSTAYVLLLLLLLYVFSWLFVRFFGEVQMIRHSRLQGRKRHQRQQQQCCRRCCLPPRERLSSGSRQRMPAQRPTGGGYRRIRE